MDKIEISIEQIYRGKLSAMRAIDALRDTIKDFITLKGGYVNTANNDRQKDNIHSALYVEGDVLVAVNIKALKLVGDSVYCYCVEETSNHITYADKDMLEDNDRWYLLDITSDLVYSYSVLSIADVLEYGEYR